MASEFTLPLTAEGAVTAPSGVFTVPVPSAESETFLDVGSANVLELPEFGWAVADGVNPIRFLVRGSVLNCGGQAPETAPIVTPTGTRASCRWDTDNGGAYVIVDGDFVTIRGTIVTFKTALSAAPLFPEVLIAGSTANALINMKAFINQTGAEGVDYNSAGVDFSASMEATTLTSTDISLFALAYGTAPNSWAVTYTGGAGPRWEQEAANVATSVFTGGAAGSGSAPASGTYRYLYTNYRSTDQAETGPSPVASGSQTAAQNIGLSGLTANADTTFDYTRIYRTAKSGVEFYLLGAVPRATTTFTDDITDTVLVRGEPYNTALYRSYAEGLPPVGLALAYWKGQLWTGGARQHAEYSRGTAAVTEDSDDVTISVKGITQRMVGRTFQVASTSEEYTILSVDESARTMVLDRAYSGTTNGTASYTIKDKRDASRMHASVAFKFNQFPVDNSPGRIETDDDGGLTAYLATKSRLFAFSKTSVAAVTGDGPESWEISKVAEGVGCVSQRLCIGVEGGGVFLSPDGFYAISPDESLTCLSSPKVPVKAMARGIDATVARINWACVDAGYAEYDRTDRVVLFGVPLDGALVPNYEIVFDLQNSTWTLYKRAEWTAMTRITMPSGALATLAGDREGKLWHVGIGESDGFYGTEAVQTLSGAQTVRTLTVSGTPFTSSALIGMPVIVLYADGTTVAYGKVAANTSSAITLAEDLSSAPAANDQIVVGGIGWQAKSGFPTWGEEYRRKTLRSVTIRHALSTRGDYWFSFAVDGGSFSLPPVGTGLGSLTEADGKVRHMTQWPGDTHAINLRGFKPGGRAIIRGGVFDLLMRENG